MLKNHRFLKISLQAALALLFIASAFYIATAVREDSALRALIADYGYVSIFISAFINGFNLFVPVPTVAFIPLFLESGLAYWWSIAVIVLGVTLADTVSYLLGKVGKQIIHLSSENKTLLRLTRLGEKHHWAPLVVLFLFSSSAPLPNELLLLPMGFLGYRFWKIFFIVLAGNFVFNALVATGIVQIYQFF